MVNITLKELARELGVSTTLVSRVLNAPLRADGTPDCDISRDTARRVLELVDKYNYKPSRMAAGLRGGKRYMLGVITPDIANASFSATGRRIEELASADGYSIMFGSSDERPDRQLELIDHFIGQKVDGIIVTPCAGEDRSLQKVVDQGIPLVLINRNIPSLEGVGRVLQDYAGSTRAVVKHLLGNGYRRIEMISENMDVLSLKERERSYCETMIANGLEPHIYKVESITQEIETRQAVRDALKKGTEALITPRIVLSINALLELMDAGARIPEDMAIVCHDDSPAWITHSPTITYVSQRSDDVGTLAYRLLCRMMKGELAEQIMVPPRLVLGGSTVKR